MMQLSLCLAAALPPRPGFLESVSYQVVGLVVVFIALGSIWLLMELMGWIFRGLARHRDAAALASAPAVPSITPEAPVTPAGITPEVIAVLTAAVNEMLESRGRIVGITSVEAHPSEFNVQMLAWASDGRRRLLDSHRPH